MLRNFIGLIVIVLFWVACSWFLMGCSANLSWDTFWWEDAEPRTKMPWYGGSDGLANRHGGIDASKNAHFNTLND